MCYFTQTQKIGWRCVISSYYLFICSYYLSQRFQKQLLIKALKKFSEYICRQLKWHQHKIRSRSSISLEITLSLNVSFIPCSTKILTLATAPFLFILIGVFCKFAMVPSVHILLSYQEKEVHYSTWRKRCTQSAAHSSKRFEPLSATILLWQGHC